MSFQYVSSMRRPLGRNQAANVDPSAETLSRGHSLARILGVGAVALVAAWLAVKAAFVMARDRGLPTTLSVPRCAIGRTFSLI